MYFGCYIYVLLLFNMPEMAHDWINKSILFYSIHISFWMFQAMNGIVGKLMMSHWFWVDLW